MKKLATLVFALLLGASLSLAQTSGGTAGSKTDTGKDKTSTTAGKKGSKTKTKSHKGGKKGKKTTGGSTTPPPK